MSLVKITEAGSTEIGRYVLQSFCEQMKSTAKDLMNEGHALLLGEELEAMVLLCINRRFIKTCQGEMDG